MTTISLETVVIKKVFIHGFVPCMFSLPPVCDAYWQRINRVLGYNLLMNELSFDILLVVK